MIIIKKILFINSSLSGGGSERVMSLLANQMSEDGYDVSMAICTKNKETYKLNKKINYFYLQENKGFISMRLTRIKEIRRAIKMEKPNTIISFMGTINVYVLIASIGLGIPIIVSERNDPKKRKKSKFLFEQILYLLLANHVVFQTELVRSYFKKGIQRKSSVIENPIDKDAIPIFSGDRKNKIAGIGRLTEQKNFPLLIDSFAEFTSKYNYELHIFGEGSLLESLKNQVKKLNIEEKVFFHGYVNDVNNEIKDYKMYISTSNFEGISNAMLEAMAMGIPTICTDCPVGGARTTIENDKNGILIPMNDKKALIDAMEKIERNKVFSDKISNEAKKISNKISLKKIATKWEKLIENK